MPKWEEMTADERREQLWKSWLQPANVTFSSPAAGKAYKARVTRFRNAIELKKAPDRVPIFPVVGWFPAYYSGMTPHDMMYDLAKLHAAYKKYVVDFQPDAHMGIMVAPPGKFFEILDYKLYAWPGHGVSKDVGYQALEGEYMTAEEYDALITDPTDFFMRAYLPRVFAALGPFRELSPLTNILEIYGGFSAANILPFGLPDVQTAVKKLMTAGEEALKWIGTVGAFEKEMTELGYPDFFGGGCKAPYDTLSDTLRGTKGIMIDIYRRPEKVLKAMEVIVPLMVRMGADTAKHNGNPIVFLPLHKGADGFLSDAQFRKFYWPTLKAVLLGLIDEGCVPFCWAEGGFNTRLEVIKDFPKGKMIWGFDRTDMAQVKKVLGSVCCIGGNVPQSLLDTGTVAEVKANIKGLINACGKGGGYIVMTGASFDWTKPENVHAMIDATKEYGVYKK